MFDIMQSRQRSHSAAGRKWHQKSFASSWGRRSVLVHWYVTWQIFVHSSIQVVQALRLVSLPTNVCCKKKEEEEKRSVLWEPYIKQHIVLQEAGSSLIFWYWRQIRGRKQVVSLMLAKVILSLFFWRCHVTEKIAILLVLKQYKY